jgi:hypothetical protein
MMIVMVPTAMMPIPMRPTAAVATMVVIVRQGGGGKAAKHQRGQKAKRRDTAGVPRGINSTGHRDLLWGEW